MQKITPFLWYDGQAEEAMNFYISIFKNSKVVTVARYGDAGPGPKGSVMTGIPAGRAGFCCAERRATIQIYACHLVRGEL
jgi:hypothetical protein